jgi:hypothetical protein
MDRAVSTAICSGSVSVSVFLYVVVHIVLCFCIVSVVIVASRCKLSFGRPLVVKILHCPWFVLIFVKSPSFQFPVFFFVFSSLSVYFYFNFLF